MKVEPQHPPDDEPEGAQSGPDLETDPLIAELRKVYDGIVDEPVPEHLLRLLEKLDEVERNR